MFRFYFPENIYQNSSSFFESVIITLLGALIGALIGFLGAMRLQRRTEMRAAIEKLTLLSNLIDDVLILIPKHIKSFDKLLEELKSEPYEMHSLGRVPSTDLDRLISILKEEVFSSIALVFGNDASVFYRNIRKSIDSIYLIDIEMFERVKKQNDSTNKDQYFVRDAYDGLINILTKRRHLFRETDPSYDTNPLYIYISKLAEKSNILTKEMELGKSNIGNFSTYIIAPLLTDCAERFDKQTASIIIDIAKPAMNRLDGLKINSVAFVASCSPYNVELKNKVHELESYNITLKKKLKII